jgi:hypothetical protein
MKGVLLTCFMLWILVVRSQINLVPNPSFEVLDTCPYSLGQLEFASPWFNPNGSSPDLFNACASIGVPQNAAGWQFPNSGAGYAGIGAYNYYYNGSNINVREYVAAPLISAMQANSTYCVSFYASLSDSSFWAINRIGIFLSPSAPTQMQGETLTATPQIYFDTSNLLIDKVGWTKISGTYIATGDEQFLIIGNFFADNQTDTISGLGNFISAYYYIDDVALYELAACEAGVDRVICLEDSTPLGTVARPNVTYQWSPAAGLSDATSANPIAAPEYTTTYILTQTECDAVLRDTVTVVVDRTCHSANALFIPTLLYNTQPLFVSGLESGSKFELFDAQGKLVYRSFNYENNFYLHQLHAGVYIAVLSTPNGTVHAQKIVVLAAD